MKNHPFLHFLYRTVKLLVRVTCAIAALNTVLTTVYRVNFARKSRKGSFYAWKHGKIFYSVKGSGSPVLLVHGLKSGNSGNDLGEIGTEMAKYHEVYTIDLLGFGRSDKPWITYTNYLYVTLIRDFISDVIGDETDIYAYDGSCLFVMQANRLYGDLIGDITLVSPSRKEDVVIPKSIALRVKAVTCTPVIGTLVFNLYSLACGEFLDPLSRHVFMSRVAGYLLSDITKYDFLMTDNITIED